MLGRSFREAGLFAIAGLAAGLLAAFAATLLLSTMPFDVGPVDAQANAGVIAALVVVVLAASYIPGRRATLVHPAEGFKAN